MTACVVDAIQQSHLDGNVPPPRDFHRLLQRDLDAYYGTALAPSTHVKYEMLREGATQSGVSYPKFYAWAVFPLASGEARRGAVRLAAIDGERFEVTDFVSEAEIKRNPERIYDLFRRQCAKESRPR